MDQRSNSETFDSIVNYRRSCRIYDQKADFDEKVVLRSLQRAHLAPNSSNMQLWNFIRVKSKDVKKDLASLCFGQSAATTANELVVFVTRRDLYKERANYLKSHYLKQLGKTEAELDKKERQRYNYWNKIMPFLYGRFGGFGGIIRWPVSFFRGLSKPMYREVSNNSMRVSAHKSVGLATQTFMLSMAAEGYDTCPMEGFDSKRVKKLLRLPKRAEVNMIISVGKRKPEGIYGERVRVPFNEVYSEI